jgi:hypothetical protein
MPGLEADLDLGPIEIMAGVRAELSTLNRNNEEWRRREFLRARVPSFVRQVQNVTIPAGGPRVGMGLTGPRPGYYMKLRRLIIGGLTWKTTAAGTAECYITPLSSGSIGALGLSEMFDQAPTLPDKAYYSDDQVWVHPGEHIQIVIDSGTAAQQYVASGLFEVWRSLSGPNEFES